MTTADPTSRATATFRLEAARSAGFSLAVPGTEYVLELAAAGPTGVPVGKRVRGTVSGRALKMHRASAGGEFIEPVEGHPRIVQGRIREVDPASNRVLLQAVFPMWIECSTGQSARDFAAGDIVNFHVESGVRFAPEA